MADKAPPLRRPKKTARSRSKASAPRVKAGGKATAKTREANLASENVMIKGEIPEALAYFLDVYERLGRG